MSSKQEPFEPIRVGIDVGGIFTDVIVINERGKQWHVKVRSTPDNSSIGVLEGLKNALELADLHPKQVQYLLHGTTVATNAVLQRKGARVSLITTKGFEDLLEIGRQQRPKLYDLAVDRNPPLVSRNQIISVSERILADGSEHISLTREETTQAVKQAKKNVDAIAVCLLFAYQNPIHERLILKEINKQDSSIPVSISSVILPEYREFERMSTTVLNAYVSPVLGQYLQHLEAALETIGLTTPLLVMQSHGGVLQSDLARNQAVRLLFSGLAGGTLGGRYISQTMQENNIITFDMGGTSTDVALITRGVIRETAEGQIGGFPCRVPMADVETVGAGGGSIGWIDAGGILRVGPQSAGAHPGPASYGTGGTEPTVTDANLILGRLNPEYFLGGAIALQSNLALRSIQSIAKKLDLSPEECGYGIIRVVNANMERAIRVVSIQRGFDPRDFALVAFGGAGPMHAWALAQNLGIPRVIIPNAPGLHSALGLLATNLRTDQSQTVLESTKSPDFNLLQQTFEQIEDELNNKLNEQGISEDKLSLHRLADLRYTGQAYEITLSTPTGKIDKKWIGQLETAFHNQHRLQYGYNDPSSPVTIVNLRVIAQGQMPDLKLAQIPKQQGALKPKSHRKVFFEELGQPITTPIFERSSLGYGAELIGPAIIEQLDSTIIVHPKSVAKVHRGGNIILEESS